MTIVNLIHVGDEVKNLDSMSREERQKIAQTLNEQALRTMGYECKKEKTV